MATSAQYADFGGESFAPSALPNWPQIGSGIPPSKSASADWTHAAFQRNVYYYPDTSHATPGALDRPAASSCYSVFPFPNTGVPGWNSYLFFGGKGGAPCNP